MKIRHASQASGANGIENTFVAYDDNNREIATCEVFPKVLPALYPERPLRIAIAASGEAEPMMALYGAATARAQLIARQKKLAARAFVETDAADEATIAMLMPLGYQDDDGVMRLRRMTADGVLERPLPAGFAVVRDFLLDATERKYFLERYNALYGMQADEAWLSTITGKSNFARILLVSNEGLGGELLVWSEGGVGVIGILQTVLKYRRRGIAAYLIEEAQAYFASCGVESVLFDVQLSMPGAMRLAETCGFERERMLLRYPGMNI